MIVYSISFNHLLCFERFEKFSLVVWLACLLLLIHKLNRMMKRRDDEKTSHGPWAGVVFYEENPGATFEWPPKIQEATSSTQVLIQERRSFQFLLVPPLQIDEIRLNLVLFAFHRDDPHGTSVVERLCRGQIPEDRCNSDKLTLFISEN